MWRWWVSFAGVLSTVLLLWGCSARPPMVVREEPWRPVEEQACINNRVVHESRFVQSRSSLGGLSACGAAHPYEVSGTRDGRVLLRPSAMLRCPMVPAVERWIAQVIEPAARAHIGAPVTELKVAASYACRSMNNQWGARISEHAFANALDVSEFKFADGRKISVRSGWWGDVRERAFLRAVHRGACHEFTTVLGPDADRYHHDHFHVDLARHGRAGEIRICK